MPRTTARRAVGFVIMLLALIYVYIETRFFASTGWLPESGDEILADGLGLILFAIGLMLIPDRDDDFRR